MKYFSAVDYAVKIRVNPQKTGIDTKVKHSMVKRYFVISLLQVIFNKTKQNPFDEIGRYIFNSFLHLELA